MSLSEKLKEQDSLLLFLVLECLSLCSFGLGNINYVFYGLGIIVGAASLLLCFSKFKGENLKTLLFFAVPMFVLSFFVSFGKLLSGNVFLNILVFLSINIFLFMGMVMRRFKGFDINVVLIVIGFSIALLVLISVIYTWTQYGFFYAARFKNTPIYYYNAETFDITKESGFLVGFKFLDVDLHYTSVFAVLLCCYLFALPFASPKENKRVFYMYLGLGVLGIIYLLTLPNFKAFIFLIPGLAVSLCYKFLKDNKLFNIIIEYVFIGLAALAIVFFFIALRNASGAGISNTIANNAFLNRIFNTNRIMTNVNPILKECSLTANLFGFITEFNDSKVTYSQFEEIKDAILTNSKMFEIELIKESGLFSVIVLVVLIIIVYVFAKKHLFESKDKDFTKVVLVGLILTYFVYQSFEYSAFPLVHEPTNYYAFFRHPLTLVIIALIGLLYPFNADAKPVEKTKPEAKVETMEENTYEI